jgi:hypothetical protein
MPQNFPFTLPLTKKFAAVNYNEKKLEVNWESHRLELEVEGNIAFIEYKLDNDTCQLLKNFLMEIRKPYARHCN